MFPRFSLKFSQFLDTPTPSTDYLFILACFRVNCRTDETQAPTETLKTQFFLPATKNKIFDLAKLAEGYVG